MEKQESTVSPKLQERLDLIDFRLRFLGDVRRPDLIERFGIAPAVATRDLAGYREIAPGNMVFDDSRKTYVASQDFRPVFTHDPADVLNALTTGIGDCHQHTAIGYVPSESTQRLNTPSLQVIEAISRAIHQQRAVRLVYHTAMGPSEREVVPFALVDSGQQWLVRAYDREAQQFCDLVPTRMADLVLLDGAVLPHERSDQDQQWVRIVPLELVPHPALPTPEMVCLDFAMVGGVLKLEARAAVVGYLLRQWGVDCSEDHALDPARHPLWLVGAPYTLHGVSSAVLAPGFAQC